MQNESACIITPNFI